MAPEKFERSKERLEKSVQAAIAEGVHIARMADKVEAAKQLDGSCRCPLGCLILHTKWRYPSTGLLLVNAQPPVELTRAEIGAFIIGFEVGDAINPDDRVFVAENDAAAYLALGQEYYRKYASALERTWP